jgi:hypothetical protein
MKDELRSRPQTYGGAWIAYTSKALGYRPRKTRCDEAIRSNSRPEMARRTVEIADAIEKAPA